MGFFGDDQDLARGFLLQSVYLCRIMPILGSCQYHCLFTLPNKLYPVSSLMEIWATPELLSSHQLKKEAVNRLKSTETT